MSPLNDNRPGIPDEIEREIDGRIYSAGKPRGWQKQTEFGAGGLIVIVTTGTQEAIIQLTMNYFNQQWQSV